jgi:hypothetical protein
MLKGSNRKKKRKKKMAEWVEFYKRLDLVHN